MDCITCLAMEQMYPFPLGLSNCSLHHFISVMLFRIFLYEIQHYSLSSLAVMLAVIYSHLLGTCYKNMLMLNECIDRQESLANAKVNARQHWHFR